MIGAASDLYRALRQAVPSRLARGDRRCFWILIDVDLEDARRDRLEAIESEFLLLQRTSKGNRRIVSPAAQFSFQIADSQKGRSINLSRTSLHRIFALIALAHLSSTFGAVCPASDSRSRTFRAKPWPSNAPP